jgi:hydrogenase 3 maturation protease
MSWSNTFQGMLPELEKIIRLENTTLLFAGIGNVLKNDDGVGVYIAERIVNSAGIISLPVEVSIENYIGKINSLKPDILILIDCVNMNSSPGTCKMLSPDKIQDLTFNTHNISLRRINELFTMPVFILGIQPESVGFGENISYLVKEVADNIIQLINKQEVYYGY